MEEERKHIHYPFPEFKLRAADILYTQIKLWQQFTCDQSECRMEMF